jgi:hypothetical protein
VLWTKKVPPTAKSRNANTEEIFSYSPKMNQNQQDRRDRNQILILPSDSPIYFALAINQLRLNGS